MKSTVFIICTVLLVVATTIAAAEETNKLPVQDDQAKELSGMSIVGNDEAPKSLYIVPWKSSEIGVETSLDMMLDKDAVPVDRDVFKRQLDYYQVSITNRSGRTK
jgi:hypothetical protein